VGVRVPPFGIIFSATHTRLFILLIFYRHLKVRDIFRCLEIRNS
jgi:hypothetical protein